MNYRHIFHAGNFADVFKHAVLSLLLKSLHKKDTPFCYLDTHAGTGRYNLDSEAAGRTGEFREGIHRLWKSRAEFPELADYFSAISAMNPDMSADSLPRVYPGSPRLARSFLRPRDRMVLLELQPDECAQLKGEFSGDRQVHVYPQDGYAGLKAFLPPKERRGLVLLDPPYEAADEYEQVVRGLRSACERWATGVYVLWYPIKDRPPLERFYRALVGTGIRKMLLAELCVYPEDSTFRLSGCGMILVNPPWQLDEMLQGLVPRLFEVLRQDNAGRAEVSWLVPE